MDNATENLNSTSWDSPPPTFFPSRVELITESATRKEIEIGQQQFNTQSTVVQHPLNVESGKKTQTAYETKNIGTQEFIQQTTRDEGERGCVEQVESEDVLQNPPEQENQSAQTQTKRSAKGWNEQNSFQGLRADY